MSPQPPLTLGTAGHIDHGKTSLIRALTGTDTDRLPQERQRGISIELGYAALTLPSGRRLSVIDVPGHERFVRTMVAGASGIDLYLLTVAADDGVMPQTREHAAVLGALGVGVGVVAVTKADLADPSRALREARELLGPVPAVTVSARTGTGLAELAAALEGAAGSVAGRSLAPGPARLHIDRVFTIRGAGTVVTGTLWFGEIGRGDRLRVLPSGLAVRVRSVQVHDEPHERAQAGQRVAVNLTGVDREQIARGDVLAAADSNVEPTYLIDAQLGFSGREPVGGERVQIHHGTRDTPARLAWLGGDFWQLRLEQSLIAAPGDRLVLRQIAPPDTLGGGTVLDPRPRKHGPSRELTARLARLARGEADSDSDGQATGGAAPARNSRQAVARGGAPRELTPGALALERRLRDAGLEPPLDSQLDPSDLAALRDAGRAIRVSKTLHYHPDVLAKVHASVIALARAGGGVVTLAELRDELGTSRKFAQALLEHFDSERVLIRRGDTHVLRGCER